MIVPENEMTFDFVAAAITLKATKTWYPGLYAMTRNGWPGENRKCVVYDDTDGFIIDGSEPPARYYPNYADVIAEDWYITKSNTSCGALHV